MKRTALFLPLLLATATAAYSQADMPPGPPAGAAQMQIETLAKDLALSDAQTAKVKTILDEQRAKRDAERQQVQTSGQRPSREDMQARRQQSEAELRTKLGTVLSADQLVKYDELQKNRRQMGGRPPGAPPAQ